MDTKRVAIVAVFAALAIILNPDVSRISFPAPFLPFLPYQNWEIPIFTAFLLLGPKPGLFIALIGSAGPLAFHPTFIAVGGIIACLAMLGGFYPSIQTRHAQRPSKERAVNQENGNSHHSRCGNISRWGYGDPELLYAPADALFDRA